MRFEKLGKSIGHVLSAHEEKRSTNGLSLVRKRQPKTCCMRQYSKDLRMVLGIACELITNLLPQP